ncbi:M48 family metallopeptidase [Kitasatospora sp. NPDC054939]
MPNTVSAVAHPQVCPHCAAPLDADPRFTVWCPECEWNLVSEEEAAEHAAKDPRTLAREQAAAERTDQVFQEVLAGRADTTRRDWLAASAVAGLVHLATVGLAGWALWLLVTGTTPLRCLGAVLLAAAFLLRPRLGRVPNDAGVLDRAAAPALYGLTDRLAAELGAPPVGVIRVDDSYGSGMCVVGLRRTSVLTLGLPFWEALDDRERTALLGHELAHRINGDHRHGLWLGSAVDALVHWHDLARPRERSTGFNVLMLLADHLANAVLKVLSRVLLHVLLLLDRLTARAGQQAEYRADELSARAGSSEGATGLLMASLQSGTIETVVDRVRARILSRPRTGHRDPAPAADTDLLWQELRTRLADVPEQEWERLLRRSRHEGHTVDATHPPTHLRIALVAGRPPVPAAVTPTTAECAAIDAELAVHRTRIARALLAG